jgi:hypothetical protein
MTSEATIAAGQIDRPPDPLARDPWSVPTLVLMTPPLLAFSVRMQRP